VSKALPSGTGQCNKVDRHQTRDTQKVAMWRKNRQKYKIGGLDLPVYGEGFLEEVMLELRAEG
jgi:hypothetical protein